MILIDIVIAMSIALFGLLIISGSLNDAKQIYYRTSSKNILIKQFIEQVENKRFPIDPDKIKYSIVPYGNNYSKIEYEVGYQSSSSPYVARPIMFTKLQKKDSSFLNDHICSANISHMESFGEFFSNISANLVKKEIRLPLSNEAGLTDIKIIGDYMLASADSAITSDPDLYIFDISSTSANLLSSIDSGPGISSFFISGNYVYSAAASTAAQLHIFNIINPQSISLVKKYKLPLPYATATSPFSSSIFVKDNKVYLGTEKWDGEEFSIIDITDKQNPQKISGLETSGKVNEIVVRNSMAYIASSDSKQLRLVDLTIETAPTLSQYFSPSGFNRQEGKSISYFENQLFWGRTSGGFDLIQDHELFKFEGNEASKQISTNMPGGVYGIVNDKENTYLISSTDQKQLQIFHRNLNDPNWNFSSSSSIDLGFKPKKLTCDNHVLYILDRDRPVVYEIYYE